eukprot:364688-Chlamydomonas_euryale.AAC.7
MESDARHARAVAPAGEHAAAGRKVPHFCGVVLGAGGEPACVWRERHRHHLLAVAHQRQHALAGRRVPNLRECERGAGVDGGRVWTWGMDVDSSTKGLRRGRLQWRGVYVCLCGQLHGGVAVREVAVAWCVSCMQKGGGEQDGCSGCRSPMLGAGPRHLNPRADAATKEQGKEQVESVE